MQFSWLNTVCGKPIAFKWRVGDFSGPCYVLIQCSLSVSDLELQNCINILILITGLAGGSISHY